MPMIRQWCDTCRTHHEVPTLEVPRPTALVTGVCESCGARAAGRSERAVQEALDDRHEWARLKRAAAGLGLPMQDEPLRVERAS